MMYIK